jgi:transposase
LWYNLPMNTQDSSARLIEELSDKLLQQEQQIAELSAKLKWYEEQFRLNRQMKFGASSEKTDIEQLNLFNEAEATANPKAEEPTLETVTYQRRKKQARNRAELLKDLPEEVIEYRLEEHEKVCPSCQGDLHEMSTQIRQEIKVIPAQVLVVKHVQHIYACRQCEQESSTIIKAPMPAPLLPGTLASPSMVAYIMDQKYTNSLPLYRQEQQFSRLGIDLSRQTMANWLLAAADPWLKLIYDRMHEQLVQRDILHADESTLQVLREPGRPAESKSYMWLYRTGKDGPPIVLYDYQTTRAGKHPANFLTGFKGYLQTDGYSGYGQLKDVTLVGCWAHARRKFSEALKALPAEQKNKPVAASVGLDYCNQLFAIERQLKEQDLSDEERYKKRLKLTKPVLDNFYIWLKKQRQQVLPKSTFGQAIIYCLNQWENLNHFLLDGRLEIDNNRAERSIKPFVIGRKNFLFCNTPRGAKCSATIYSIIETAKENNLKPFNYLTYLFEQLPNVDTGDEAVIDSLLPWLDTLPAECRMPQHA